MSLYAHCDLCAELFPVSCGADICKHCEVILFELEYLNVTQPNN